ncbi:MAG: hypothetical protein M1131_02700 [Actinobacteria bacterium]|nr:hypothetical protein [Actinomycetota bacterium]MCL6095883.1 hypothetical protein [Actinomycetota bacterium]
MTVEDHTAGTACTLIKRGYVFGHREQRIVGQPVPLDPPWIPLERLLAMR